MRNSRSAAKPLFAYTSVAMDFATSKNKQDIEKWLRKYKGKIVEYFEPEEYSNWKPSASVRFTNRRDAEKFLIGYSGDSSPITLKADMLEFFPDSTTGFQSRSASKPLFAYISVAMDFATAKNKQDIEKWLRKYKGKIVEYFEPEEYSNWNPSASVRFVNRRDAEKFLIGYSGDSSPAALKEDMLEFFPSSTTGFQSRSAANTFLSADGLLDMSKLAKLRSRVNKEIKKATLYSKSGIFMLPGITVTQARTLTKAIEEQGYTLKNKAAKGDNGLAFFQVTAKASGLAKINAYILKNIDLKPMGAYTITKKAKTAKFSASQAKVPNNSVYLARRAVTVSKRRSVTESSIELLSIYPKNILDKATQALVTKAESAITQHTKKAEKVKVKNKEARIVIADQRTAAFESAVPALKEMLTDLGIKESNIIVTVGMGGRSIIAKQPNGTIIRLALADDKQFKAARKAEREANSESASHPMVIAKYADLYEIPGAGPSDDLDNDNVQKAIHAALGLPNRGTFIQFPDDGSSEGFSISDKKEAYLLSSNYAKDIQSQLDVYGKFVVYLDDKSQDGPFNGDASPVAGTVKSFGNFGKALAYWKLLAKRV